MDILTRCFDPNLRLKRNSVALPNARLRRATHHALVVCTPCLSTSGSKTKDARVTAAADVREGEFSNKDMLQNENEIEVKQTKREEVAADGVLATAATRVEGPPVRFTCGGSGSHANTHPRLSSAVALTDSTQPWTPNSKTIGGWSAGPLRKDSLEPGTGQSATLLASAPREASLEAAEHPQRRRFQATTQDAVRPTSAPLLSTRQEALRQEVLSQPSGTRASSPARRHPSARTASAASIQLVDVGPRGTIQAKLVDLRPRSRMSTGIGATLGTVTSPLALSSPDPSGVQTPTPAEAKASVSFLTLPRSIRNRIYDIAFTATVKVEYTHRAESSYALLPAADADDPLPANPFASKRGMYLKRRPQYTNVSALPIALLATSRRVRAEAQAHVFGAPMWVFSSVRDLEEWVRDVVGEAWVGLVRRVRVERYAHTERYCWGVGSKGRNGQGCLAALRGLRELECAVWLPVCEDKEGRLGCVDRRGYFLGGGRRDGSKMHWQDVRTWDWVQDFKALKLERVSVEVGFRRPEVGGVQASVEWMETFMRGVRPSREGRAEHAEYIRRILLD